MKGRILAAAFVLLSLAACARTVAIRDIIDHPREYAGKEVTVAGEVNDTFSFLTIKYFTVNDGTGKIAVFSDKPLPKQGEKISVTGRIEEAFSIGPETLTVLIEEGTKEKPR